jgi:hypothetical protein
MIPLVSRGWAFSVLCFVLPSTVLAFEIGERYSVSAEIMTNVESPVNVDSCEIDRGNKPDSKYKVKDFLVDYLAISLDPAANSRLSFQCQEGQPKRCHVSYGGGTGNELWDRFLTFDYDSENGKIISSTFRCVDTP